MNVSDDELRRLTSLRHGDPHSILGARADRGGLAIRVFRPDATAVSAVGPNGEQAELKARPGVPGIFEGRLERGRPGDLYRLRVHYGNRTFELHDPYSFLPTLGEQDLYFHGEGRHLRLWDRLGAHPLIHQGVGGTAFAVWAPNASGLSVVGDFNGWDGRIHPMRTLGNSGIWELFLPEVSEGARYKFEVRPHGGGPPFLKADPMAFRTETPPLTASVVHNLSHYRWNDTKWLEGRPARQGENQPLSIYEVHLPSWRTVPEEGNRSLTYREAAPLLADHLERHGFTHLELLPIAEHPFGGSWGYQVSAYFAPTSRHGHPDDFRYLVDYLHQRGFGVLVDWVPGHFPRDAFALGRFDGTALYEHEDPRLGAHPDWGTLIFNFGRNEVKNFLIANALFWLDQYHLDGLRVDAVASMLYRDYSRKAGEWVPNVYGGRENLEAIAFLKELNAAIEQRAPGTLMIAEESTAWPQVSRPVREGGLGFTNKWNMGWMHDTLAYFETDPLFRKHHHHQLTFGLLYAFSERFVMPLSHDEVVHGKKSLISKMPGDDWQRFANLRALYGWMWSHPGKKLLFMGAELGQWGEWNHERSLDWHLLQSPRHAALSGLVGRLNALLKQEKALHTNDFDGRGFHWVQADASDFNVYAFVRRADGARPVLCVANLSPMVREGYRVGVPQGGRWEVLLDTDQREWGGSGAGPESTVADGPAWDGQPASLSLRLPPLSVLWLSPG
ncbi:MAG: 1,4-alpha-glucan branching protein GlgB [Myxococcaceae bacterium]